MARETNNRGLRAPRNIGSGGLFGISDMYRGIISPRTFRMSRTELLPTIPSGTEIDETYISQGATTHSSDDSIESSDIRRNANTQIRRICNTNKSAGMHQTDDGLLSSSHDIFSQYQPYERTDSRISASTELQYDGSSENYSKVTKPTIPEIRNPTFFEDSNSSCNETSNSSFVGRFSTYNNEIRENPANLSNVQRSIACSGCRFSQTDAGKVFAGSGLSGVSEKKINRKPDAACDARENFQTPVRNKANEPTHVDPSDIGSLYNSPICNFHRGSLHVCRNEEDSRRFEINGKTQTLAKAELDNHTLSKSGQEMGVISYPDNSRRGLNGSETSNKITEGRNRELLVKMNGNTRGSRFQKDPPFSEIPDSRNMQESPWSQTPANRRPGGKNVAHSNVICSGGVNVGCVGTCGGFPARHTGASCASTIIPRGTGFPKHARMFGASMPYKNKGLSGGVGNCGISLLPRVCKTVRSRHDACHRGYTHPIIRTIADSGIDGVSRCTAKTQGKKRRQTTNTDLFCCGGTENSASCSTYENVESGVAWPSPTTGDVFNSPKTENRCGSS